MDKVRLDVLLMERGLVPSREKGRRLIMAGQVRVAGQLSDKPGQRVPADAEIAVDGGQPFVSRGGQKLEAALDRFRVVAVPLAPRVPFGRERIRARVRVRQFAGEPFARYAAEPLDIHSQQITFAGSDKARFREHDVPPAPQQLTTLIV